MKILSSIHQKDLWWSLQLLCNRLGAELYCMSGMEWYEQGYFMMHPHPDKKDPLGYMAKRFLVDDVWEGKALPTQRGCSDFPALRLLKFEDFKSTDIDVIICTNRENEIPFHRLKAIKPNLKFVRQVGNRFDRVDKELYPNALFSDKESYEMNSCPNQLLYHQEFDLNLFKSEPITNAKNIYSFQHNLEKYEPAEELWTQYQHQFPEYNFQSFGKGNDGGYIYPKCDYIKKMLESTFIWQVKNWEGYSHVIHNSFALGRPMILRQEDIKGRIFEPLCTRDTVIFTDQIDGLRTAYFQNMSKSCRQMFEVIVNFDAEFVSIKHLFENLL